MPQAVPGPDHGAGIGLEGKRAMINRLLRTVLVVDAAVFAGAGLFNLGARIPLGGTTLRFADPVWQAGTGELVIAATLVAAALTGRAGLAWTAFALSVLGIAIGLRSDRVQGAARDIHLVLVPLAAALLALLVARRLTAGRAPGEAG